MDVKLQLLSRGIAETLIDNIDVSGIDDKGAMSLLMEIQDIIQEYEISTTEAMYKIITLLKENGFYTKTGAIDK